MSERFLENITRGMKRKVNSTFDNPYKKLNINWLKLKYYKHLSGSRIRTHNLFGHVFYFNRPQELLHGLKEIFIDEIYRLELEPHPFIIDCGANIGMSIIYVKQKYPSAEILAFEPDESNFSLLEKNISSFGYSGVQLHKKAVWNANTVLKFSNESSMGSRVESNATSSTKDVNAVRLKDFMVRDVDFLKIDIEGAENVVLYDIADQLGMVKNMFLEYHGTFEQNKDLVNIFRIIQSAGFNFYIKEAANIYNSPFARTRNSNTPYDVQLNIFCFRG